MQALDVLAGRAELALEQGDSLVLLRALPDNSVDAIVTDPPYELGFMGRDWDRSGIAFKADLWREALRVLKPGGHLLAFSGSRTYHRMAVAIEDAGFEIRDQAMWLYGSGMPKSRDIAKYDMDGEDAAQWAGWGTGLKPSHEPICMARKPLQGTVAANVLAWGTGAINVDACRVHSADSAGYAYTAQRMMPGADQNKTGVTHQAGVVFEGHTKDGRWPANVLHDGSAEVEAIFPLSLGAKGAVTGDEPSAAGDGTVFNKRKRVASPRVGVTDFAMGPGARQEPASSAARFFYCAKASAADRHAGFEKPAPITSRGATLRDIENAPKVGNHHPTVKPTELMRYLCRLVTPAGGVVLDLFMGSGSTGRGARMEGFRFIGFELQAEFVEISRVRIADAERELAKPARTRKPKAQPPAPKPSAPAPALPAAPAAEPPAQLGLFA